jgi:hypothetical protein
MYLLLLFVLSETGSILKRSAKADSHEPALAIDISFIEVFCGAVCSTMS